MALNLLGANPLHLVVNPSYTVPDTVLALNLILLDMAVRVQIVLKEREKTVTNRRLTSSTKARIMPTARDAKARKATAGAASEVIVRDKGIGKGSGSGPRPGWTKPGREQATKWCVLERAL